MKEIVWAIRRFIRDRFSLDEDKADETQIIESIEKNIHFRGTNLWTLIFAILIACIGLNVNSYAMLIGAMLISPLMGPIMGIGLGIGILDFEMMKKGIKNLLIASIMSVLTSWLYFLLTPLRETSAELLARTTPSIWDVLVALFGGMAGIIAGTRKEKSNVLPGVAIATALLPPLCTVGFAISRGEWYFVGGALYLFFVNGVFICLATFLIVRFLKFRFRVFTSRVQQKKVTRYIWAISLVTLIPSIFLATRIVQKTIFEQNARRFVQRELNFENTQVVNQVFRFKPEKPVIDLLLVGASLDETAITELKKTMPGYDLDSNWLEIHQGLDASREIDLAQIRTSLLQEVVNSQEQGEGNRMKKHNAQTALPDVSNELRTLFPELSSYSLSSAQVYRLDSAKVDTIAIFTGLTSKTLTPADEKRLARWLEARTGKDSVQVYLRK